MIWFFSDLYYTHHKDSKPIRVVDDHFKSTHSVFWRTVATATTIAATADDLDENILVLIKG